MTMPRKGDKPAQFLRGATDLCRVVETTVNDIRSYDEANERAKELGLRYGDILKVRCGDRYRRHFVTEKSQLARWDMSLIEDPPTFYKDCDEALRVVLDHDRHYNIIQAVVGNRPVSNLHLIVYDIRSKHFLIKRDDNYIYGLLTTTPDSLLE